MGILIDIILIIIILISTFLGYKKGLVKLGAKLFAGILAIIITLILFRPVSNMIIKNTALDEKLENIIVNKTEDAIDENSKVSDNKYIQGAADNATNQVKEEILPEQAKNISINIINIMSAIILFIVVKIILSIIISLADAVANLPILKQFNEVGGILYGLIRGILIICILILLAGVFNKVNPNNNFSKEISNTYLTKIIYENIVKF